MGVDIYMSIVNKNGEYVKRDIFQGRNSDWFGNLQGDGYGYSPMYENLPRISGLPACVPEDIATAYKENYNYGFFHMTVKEFSEWFEKVRPDIDAVWLQTYDKWLYEKKGIYPVDALHYLDEDAIANNWHFVEVQDPYDCSKWLYDYVEDFSNGIDEDDIIVYYFGN